MRRTGKRVAQSGRFPIGSAPHGSNCGRVARFHRILRRCHHDGGRGRTVCANQRKVMRSSKMWLMLLLVLFVALAGCKQEAAEEEKTEEKAEGAKEGDEAGKEEGEEKAEGAEGDKAEAAEGYKAEA